MSINITKDLSKNQRAQLDKARELGAQASAKGSPQSPSLNSELMSMFEGRAVGETPENEASSIALMIAYNDGFVAENLK